MFCRSLFVFLSFFFWPLCCPSFFNIRLLITLLVSSSFSHIIVLAREIRTKGLLTPLPYLPFLILSAKVIPSLLFLLRLYLALSTRLAFTNSIPYTAIKFFFNNFISSLSEINIFKMKIFIVEKRKPHNNIGKPNNINIMNISGADPGGGGGAHPARAPLKLEKI